ncbi:mRNA-capping enzyme isoform X1 [Dendroctonus ponderosae]
MNTSITDPGPIPNRWLNCPRKANKLIIGKLLALKTPLSAKFDHVVPAECRFHPKMFFGSCKTKKLKIGLWLDLTNTNRFYDKAEIEKFGCKYIKLKCRGHGETPNKDQVNSFLELVHSFIAQHPLEIVAVHCTHGFNRTGFLIVSYLIEKMDFCLDVALQTFADARPVGIYKQDYLAELYRVYDDIKDMPPAPTLPDWCLESDDSNGNEANGDSYAAPSSSRYSSASTKSHALDKICFTRSSRRNNHTTKFMSGVPGVSHFDAQPRAFHLQSKVQTMCGWKERDFPGCQPVSMDQSNLKLLHKKPYRVSWKADGMRYMMLIDGEDEVYFFDRNHTVFKVDGVKFVSRKDLKSHLKNTLLDGEMVIDKVGGEDIPRYLAYDIIKFDGKDVGNCPFYPSRLQCLEMEVIKPRYAAMEHGLINKSAEPFSVRKKEFWPISQAGNLLGEKFAKSLSHEPDGLIFQPSNEKYVAGRCDEVLKWKPLSLNSVDFRLKIAVPNQPGVIPVKTAYLYVGQFDQPYGKMTYKKSMKDLDGKIVECKYENGEWKFMRERTDKTYPNSFNTAEAVYGSIANPVTKEQLLEFIEHHGYHTQMMPPEPKRPKRSHIPNNR